MSEVVKADSRAMRRFHDAMRDLTKIAGGDFQRVIKHELGAVLSNAVRNTKRATKETIKTNHERQPGAHYGFEYAGPESRTGRQYSQAEIVRARKRAAEARASGKRGKALYYLKGSSKPHRYPSWLWRQIEEARAKSLPKKQKSRALAASMWVKIGDKLNIPVKAAGYIRTAESPSKGPMLQAIEVLENKSGKKYSVGFINNLTHTNKWAGSGVAFRRALTARANYFTQAVKLEAKGIIKKTMDRYPGLARVS